MFYTVKNGFRERGMALNEEGSLRFLTALGRENQIDGSTLNAKRCAHIKRLEDI